MRDTGCWTLEAEFDFVAIVGSCYPMSAALTKYWEEFIDELVKSGRYNNRSEVIRAGLRALEELERARESLIKKGKSKRK